jgi:hypothetical protein
MVFAASSGVNVSVISPVEVRDVLATVPPESDTTACNVIVEPDFDDMFMVNV